MRSVLFISVTFILFSIADCAAQTDIKKELRIANPVKPSDTFSFSKKLGIHEKYLSDAIAAKDKKRQFYGNIFQWSDFFNQSNYPAAIKSVLQAEKIALESGNRSWEGACYLRKGIVLCELDRSGEAITNFKKSLNCCIETKDSLGTGDSMEEIAIVYKRMEKYDSSLFYYHEALPYVEKFAAKDRLSSYLNNYGNLLMLTGKFPEAKKYMDSSISIIMQTTNVYLQMTYKNNLAVLYEKMGNDKGAFEILDSCIAINKKFNWPDLLINNYSMLQDLYFKKHDYLSAYRFLESYHQVNDSIKGADVQVKIAELSSKVEAEQAELKLQKSKLELVNAKRLSETRFWIIVLGLTTMSFIAWYFFSRSKKSKKELQKNREDLSTLTQLLIDKNSLLAEQEETILNLKTTNPVSPANGHENIPGPEDFEKNLYNQRILTKEDWSSFKIYFEKAYPGYLFRLRDRFPALTEAEERIFLFIKLNLKNKEAAAILGISADSVNKTRIRLRKRLALEESVDLDEYVKGF